MIHKAAQMLLASKAVAGGQLRAADFTLQPGSAVTGGNLAEEVVEGNVELLLTGGEGSPEWPVAAWVGDYYNGSTGTVTIPAPVAVAPISDATGTVGGAALEIPTAGAFQGAGISYSVSGGGASINASTGVVTIATGSALNAVTITVTATNSSGSASTAFQVTISEPSGDYPEFPAAAVTDARSKANLKFTRTSAGGSGTNGGFFGPACVAVALAAWLGDDTQEAAVRSQLRTWLDGANAPNACGNYTAQYELFAVATICLASVTPGVWDNMQAYEKTRLDFIVEQCGKGGAYVTSDLYPETGGEPMDGSANEYRPSYNSNHRNPKALTVALASAYFGASEFAQKLADFTLSSDLSKMDDYGFTSMRYAYNLHKGVTVNQFQNIIRGSTSANPNRGWRCWYKNLTPANIDEMVKEEVYEDCFGYPVVRGIGTDGKGINVNGTLYGTMITTPANEDALIAGMPNPIGTIGGAREFKANDAGGNDRRCSVQYVLGGARPGVATMIALIAMGKWPAGGATQQTIMNRYKVGWADIKYKVVTTGHRDYANGGSLTGVWEGGTGGTKYGQFGMDYSFALAEWLEAYHDGGA